MGIAGMNHAVLYVRESVLQALAQVLPGSVMAEGAGAVWTCQVSGTRDDGRSFITSMFNYAGGAGARAHKPGLSATVYPTGVAAVPIEVGKIRKFLLKQAAAGARA